jgi:hypothetical protein
MGQARGLTPLLPIYLLLISRSDLKARAEYMTVVNMEQTPNFVVELLMVYLLHACQYTTEHKQGWISHA